MAKMKEEKKVEVDLAWEHSQHNYFVENCSECFKEHEDCKHCRGRGFFYVEDAEDDVCGELCQN